MHGNKLRCVKVTHFIRTQTKHYQTSHITFHDGRAYSSVKTILNIHDGVALGEIAITEETSEISTAEDAEEAEEIDEVGVQVTTPDQRVFFASIVKVITTATSIEFLAAPRSVLIVSTRYRLGPISRKLRAALGLRDDDLPPWTYRMGEEGYPPTYLKSRRIRYS
ncbi:hypothetical protein QR680_011889 [Steinernema hermaphroditum]|uniref:PSP proline-rich domain-containing protein n=1 Tax=Steinernema hermaphroditum TaxID=289476 RepID=A0AA39I034_9BILA|nr:hypothetical protein QR680_011889 [Steinernema hermaphroditum]